MEWEEKFLAERENPVGCTTYTSTKGYALGWCKICGIVHKFYNQSSADLFVNYHKNMHNL